MREGREDNERGEGKMREGRGEDEGRERGR